MYSVLVYINIVYINVYIDICVVEYRHVYRCKTYWNKVTCILYIGILSTQHTKIIYVYKYTYIHTITLYIKTHISLTGRCLT